MPAALNSASHPARRLRVALRGFVADEAGATAIEYGLIATLIFLVIVTSVGLLGTSVSGAFGRVAAGFTAGK